MTSERWADLTDLFERKGPRGGTPMTAGCWCMWWRKRTGDPAKHKRNMRGIVRGSRSAPHDEFGRLLTSRNYEPREPEEGVH